LTIVVGCGAAFVASPAHALFVPDRLFVNLFNGPNPGPQDSTVTVNGLDSGSINHHSIAFQNPTVIQETNMVGQFAPSTQTGGMFEANEHVARFQTSAEAALPASNPAHFGHLFQRSENFDISTTVKIDTPFPNVRKEAGFYFETSPASGLGNYIWLAATNDTFYGSGPGEIGSVYNVLPSFSFSGSGGVLGDYDHSGKVDAADYTIWRDTFGSTTDFRANGNNDGASMNLIDQADYAIWKQNFGQTPSSGPAHYTVGDSLMMRMIYTPPVLNGMAFNAASPGDNVMTPGTIEYRISLNGGSVLASGPIDIANSWKGIPDGTYISLRAQNLCTQAFSPDSSTDTFSNFDFNGDLPGSGLPGGGAFASGAVPEPGTLTLAAIALVTFGMYRQRKLT
jgi:hypothetical protein